MSVQPNPLPEETYLDLTNLKSWVESWCRQLEGGSWVWLTGAVGAGKTTFANCLIETLTGHELGGSPTFPIISTYETQPHWKNATTIQKVIHGDLYRLKKPQDLLSLGLDLEWSPQSVFCMEWGDLFSTQEWEWIWPQLELPTPGFSYHLYLDQSQTKGPHRLLQWNKVGGFVAPAKGASPGQEGPKL